MTSYQLSTITTKLTNQDIYQMSHGRHVHYGLKSPSPSGCPVWIAGFIIPNTLPTMRYLLLTFCTQVYVYMVQGVHVLRFGIGKSLAMVKVMLASSLYRL